MTRGKQHTPEQIVSLFRQVEVAVASGEGRRFVLSELRYVLRRNPLLIPSVIFRTLLKYLGYSLGRKEAWFRPALKRRLGMNHRFW